jgi:hypothetical protein
MPHDDERDFAEEAANAAHMRDEHEPNVDKSDTDKSDTVGFPTDVDGNPLAWPDPTNPAHYVDAWNGDYASREEALSESADWTASESNRVLSYGQAQRVDKSDTAERRAWQAAYATAWAGASNTAGLALGIHEIIVELRASGMTWYAVDSHPAVRAMVAHLAYLTGQGLGPTDEDLRTVKNAGRV